MHRLAAWTERRIDRWGRTARHPLFWESRARSLRTVRHPRHSMRPGRIAPAAAVGALGEPHQADQGQKQQRRAVEDFFRR